MAGAPPNDNLWVGDLPDSMDDEQVRQIFGAYGAITSVKVLPPRNGKSAALIRFGSIKEATWIVENLNLNIPQGLDDPVLVQFAQPQRNASAGFAGGASGGCGSFGPRVIGPTVTKGGGAWGGKGGPVGGGKDRFSPYGGAGEAVPPPPSGPCGIQTLLSGLLQAKVFPGASRTDEKCLYIQNLPPDTTDCDLYKMFSPFGAIAPKGVTAMLNKNDGSCNGIAFVDYVEVDGAASAQLALNGTILPDGSQLNVNFKKPSKKGKGGGKGGGKGEWQGEAEFAQWPEGQGEAA